MQVEIWSDVVCPWCYIGKRRLERALDRFPRAAEVEVVWRSFELDPSAPSSGELDLVERLAAKYRVSRAEAQAMNERVTAVAAGEDLAFRLDVARPGNTFAAHRLLHLAADRGRQDAAKEGLLAAYLVRGQAVSDPSVLAGVGVAAGLDPEEVEAVLAGDAYAEAVRADERLGHELGVTAVPFFVVDRRLAVSGAQSSDVLLDLLERAWHERPAVRLVAGSGDDAAADACGPDGCLPADR